jgi:hypothetical protein
MTEECHVCEKKFAKGEGRFHYPDGDYCNDCGVTSGWYCKFSMMRASQIIKYMGINPTQYGLTKEALDELAGNF